MPGSNGIHNLAGVKKYSIMSTKTFNKGKATLLPQLRERTDPPPRRMCVGSGNPEEHFANLRTEMSLNGGTPVRGFKLFKLVVEKAYASEPVWQAFFHVVVARVTLSGTTVYVDPNNHDEDNSEYIFVPSARAHRDLTDEQILSGDWHTGSVVGGHPRFCARYVAHERLHGRARSVISRQPETLVAKPRVIVRLPPHFAEWHRISDVGIECETLAEMMGATVFPYDAAPTENAEIDAISALAFVNKNTEACVDPVRGLQLELKCTEQLLNGDLTVAEARRLFFTHFDTTHVAVRDVQTQRFAQWSKES